MTCPSRDGGREDERPPPSRTLSLSLRSHPWDGDRGTTLGPVNNERDLKSK